MSRTPERLYATDDTFREVADLLFGSGGDALIAKMNPTQSDLSTPAAKKDRRARMITAGLSATGAAAGTAGLAYGGRDMIRAVKAGKKIPKSTKAFTALEIAGLGGEVMATKILHGDTKKKKPTIAKFDLNPKRKLTRAAVETATDPKVACTAKGSLKKLDKKIHKGFFKNVKQTAENTERMTRSGAAAAENLNRMTTKASKQVRRGRLVAMGGATAGAGGVGYGLGAKKGQKKTVVEHVKKSDEEPFDVVWQGEISKVDSDKRQVFGWASIVEVNGEPVVDLQGDYISVDEIEKSAYTYVQKSRKGGDMHQRNGADPRHVSDMIESFVVTPEKKEKMGLPDSIPTGWWVGYQVHDDDTWNLVKSGQRTGFSIHGSGTRKAIDA